MDTKIFNEMVAFDFSNLNLGQEGCNLEMGKSCECDQCDCNCDDGRCVCDNCDCNSR